MAVKDLTETLEQMPMLMEAISHVLNSPIGWVSLFVFLIWLFFQKDFSQLLDLMERKKRRQIESLESYVARVDITDADTLRVLKDLRDAHYFQLATGIYVERHLRHALIRLHDELSHLITWKTIRRAMPYLDTDEQGNISIRKPSLFDKLNYRFNQFMIVVCLLGAVLTVALLLLTPTKTVSSFIMAVGTPFFMIVVAGFVGSQNWPIQSAKRICNGIEKSRLSKTHTKDA